MTFSKSEKYDLPFFYSGLDINKFKFYAVPQLLFDSDEFSNMSIDTKVLYCIMVDKSLLSHKNSERFTDDEGKIYIVYKTSDIMKDIQRGHSTISKLLSELEKRGLIEKVRSSSVDRVNRIYVKNFSYYTKQSDDKYLYNDFDFDKYLFYMLPKELMSNPVYKKISLTAKIMYMFMLERLKLSKLNQEKYSDKKGRLFIFYSIDNIQKRLNCARATAVKVLKELEMIGLIEKEQADGFNTANKIYVMDFAAGKELEILSEPEENVEILQHPNFELPNIQNLNSSTSKKQTPEHPDFELLNIQKLNSNNTYYSNTYKSNSHQSDRRNDEFDDFKNQFSESIELDILTSVDDTFIAERVSDEIKAGLSPSKYNSRFAQIKKDEVNNAIILDSLAMSVVRYIQTINSDTVDINGVSYSKAEVIEKLLSVNNLTFMMARDKILEVKKPIHNYGAYMVSVLMDLLETERLQIARVVNNL